MNRNKLLEYAMEIHEEDENMKLYYKLIKQGMTTRQAKRYMKKKLNYIVKS